MLVSERYYPIPGLNVIINEPKGEDESKALVATVQCDPEDSPQYNDIPLSEECRELLLARGDKLCKQISHGKDCSGLTSRFLSFMVEKSPKASTMGKGAGTYWGITNGPVLIKEGMDAIWSRAFPKADPTALGKVLNALSSVGKNVTKTFVTPQINPALIAASGLVGYYGLPLLFSFVIGTCKWAGGIEDEVKTLDGVPDESNVLRFDEEKLCYFNYRNEPLKKRDIKILAERMREYQLICELLSANRGDVAKMITEGLEGLPLEGEAAAASQKKIKSLIKNLTSTYAKEEKIKAGLEEAGKYYNNKKSLYSPFNQVKIKTTLENLDGIKDLLEIPADASSMYFDEATHVLQPAQGFTSWWYRQSSDHLSEKISVDLTQAVTEKLSMALKALFSDTQLGHFEANNLRTKLDEIEQSMVKFVEGIEISNSWEENEKLITASYDFCGDLNKAIKHLREQIDELEHKGSASLTTSNTDVIAKLMSNANSDHSNSSADAVIEATGSENVATQLDPNSK